MDMSIKQIMEPRSVAVVGASRNPAKLGAIILRNLVNLGFNGCIYPVNPNASEIMGLKAYPSVKDIPGEVDLAVIAVPAPQVPDVVRDCAEKMVKGVVVISSGFKDIGEQGAAIEERIVEIARKAGIRIFGPNTTGLLNASKRLATTFVPLSGLRSGDVSIIAQTGLFAGAMLEWLITSQKFGISKVIGLGNKCDVDDAEALEYLGNDPETRVILMYIEGVRDGRRFIEAARQVVGRKPIIILKSGRTEAGSKAALTHTGSLTGSSQIFNAVCRQLGLIQVLSFEEMVDLAKAFTLLPLPRGGRVAIASITGAGSVLAADSCAEHGLTVAQLSSKSLEVIQSKLPPWSRASHPIDLEPLVENMPKAIEAYNLALNTALNDENVDSMIAVLLAPHEYWRESKFWVSDEELREAFTEIRRIYSEKPLVIHLMGAKPAVDRWTEILEEIKIPVYPSIERCVKALATLVNYAKTREANIYLQQQDT